MENMKGSKLFRHLQNPPQKGLTVDIIQLDSSHASAELLANVITKEVIFIAKHPSCKKGSAPLK